MSVRRCNLIEGACAHRLRPYVPLFWSRRGAICGQISELSFTIEVEPSLAVILANPFDATAHSVQAQQHSVG